MVVEGHRIGVCVDQVWVIGGVGAVHHLRGLALSAVVVRPHAAAAGHPRAASVTTAAPAATSTTAPAATSAGCGEGA